MSNEKNQAWKKIFLEIKYEDNHHVIDGTIEKVLVNNKNNSWRFILSLPEFLNFDELDNLTKKVKKYCIKQYNISNLFFYNNIFKSTKSNSKR